MLGCFKGLRVPALVSHASTQDVTLTIGLVNYTAILTIQVSFKIIVTCQVTTLALTTPPPSQITIKVGIDTQPSETNFAVTKTPSCPQAVTFTFSGTPPGFVSLQNVLNASGDIQVTGATIADHDSYPLTLNASVDSQTASASFTVQIQDPCSYAVFETSPAPLVNMVFEIGNSTQFDQAVKIYTDVERTHSAIVCPITATLSPSKAFILLSTNYDLISILEAQITEPLHIGVHDFTLTVNSPNFSASVMEKTYNFSVTLQCTITDLQISNPVSNQTYVIRSNALVTYAFSTSQTPSYCNYPATYQASFTKSGVSISQPTWIVFDSNARTYTIQTSLVSAIDVYTVTSTGSIPCINLGTGQNWQISFSFQLTVVSDCTTTTMTPRSLAELSTIVGVPNSLDISFDDAIGTLHTNQAYCGPRSFLLTPSPAFASISGNTLTINPTLVSDASTQDVILTVGLANYTEIPTIQVSFKIIVICQVVTLAFTTPPPSLITIKVGIDTQPSETNFAVTKTPSCPQAVTFTFSGTPPGFVSLQNVLNASGDIHVTGATINNHDFYPLTLNASVDSQTASASFTVQIQDPCSYAVFETQPAPILDMSLTLYPFRSSSVQQNLRVYTDVERAYPLIICPITAQVLLSKPFILMASDYSAITIDGQYTTLADARDYLFTLRVKSSVFTSIYADYSLKVVLSACYATYFSFSSTISNVSYDTTLGTLTTTPFQTSQANEDCGYLATYSLKIAQNLISIQKPDWLATDFTQRTVSISQTQKQDVGTYDVTITASIPQVNPQTSNFSEISFPFRITIIDECLTTAFINRPFDSMIAKISQGAVEQDLTVNDAVSFRHSDVGYCGQKIYTIEPTLPFLSLIGSTLQVQTQILAHAGLHQITLRVSLVDYTGIANLVETLTVQIQCEVIQITTNQAPKDVTFRLHQDTDISTSYSFQEFPQCGLIYKLIPNEKNFIKFDSLAKKISVYSENNEDVGSYNVTLSVVPQTFGLQTTFPFKVIVTNPCLTTKIKSSTLIPNIVDLVPAKPFYEIPISFYHTAQNTTNCGAIEAKVRDVQTKQTPSWSKLEGQKLQIDLQTQTYQIKSQMELFVILSRYPDIKYEQSFNVTLNTLNVQCSPQTSNYEVGMSELSLQVFYSIQTEYKNKLTPVFSATSIDIQGNEIDGLPVFVKFVENSQTFVVQTNNPLDAGEKTVGLSIGFKELKDFKTTCSTKIKVQYNPIEDQTTECRQRWVFKMPEYNDSTGAKLAVEINLQESKAFIKIQNGFLIYEPLQIVPGDYPIKYSVVSNGFSQEFRFTLRITCSDFSVPEKEEYKPPVRPFIFVKNPPKPYIASINNAGLVKIGFTQKLLIPNYDLYPEFQRAEYMRETNSTGVWNHTAPEAARQLAQVQQNKIEAEAIEIINRGIVFIDETQLPIVQLSLKPNQQVSPEQKSFSYKCVSFKESYMEFLANFTYFDQISIQEKDVMMAKFNGPQYFRTPDDTAFTESEIVEVNKKVPQQMDVGMAKQLQKAAQLVKNSSKAAVIVNFALNMILSGALQQMLAAMKKMQLMIHMLLINVEIPPTCQIFFSSLLKLVTYEVIDISSQIREGLNLQEDAGFSSNFEQMGYQSRYSIILLGNLYIALLLTVLGLLLLFTTKRFKRIEWFKKQHKKLKASLIWNGTLALINESYLVICISCFVNILSTKQAQKFGEYFSLANTFLLLVVVLGYPILILIVLVKNQPNLQLHKYRRRFGDFYLQFRYKDGRFTLLEPCYSALRRLIHAAAVVFFASWPFMQFMVMFYSWNVICLLNSRLLRYKLKSELYTDMVNEFFIVIILYNLFVFSDYLSDQKAKNLMGFVMIGVMLLNMVFNFTLIISSSLAQLYRVLRTKYYTWKRARLLKKLKAIIALAELESEQQVNDCSIPQQSEDKIQHQFKKRDLNWYQTITLHQDQIGAADGGDFQIEVNDEFIDYNRSNEGLITIKQKKRVPNNKTNNPHRKKKQTQLQTIKESDASVEQSPWSIDPYYRGLLRQDSQLRQSQQKVTTKKLASVSQAELLQIEEENSVADEQYWNLVQQNLYKRPTLDMVAQQEAKKRQPKLQQIEEENVDLGDQWGLSNVRKEFSQYEKEVREFYTVNNMAHMLQIEEEDCIALDRSNSINVGKTRQSNLLELKAESRNQIQMEITQFTAPKSQKPSDPLNLGDAGLMNLIQLNSETLQNVSNLNSNQKGSYTDGKLKNEVLKDHSRQSSVQKFDEEFTIGSYSQKGDLNDSLEQAQRVKRRQASHRNLFANPQQSLQMFKKLWNLDQNTSEKEQNNQSKTEQNEVTRNLSHQRSFNRREDQSFWN